MTARFYAESVIVATKEHANGTIWLQRDILGLSNDNQKDDPASDMMYLRMYIFKNQLLGQTLRKEVSLRNITFFKQEGYQ
jgi:hypothetical protein